VVTQVTPASQAHQDIAGSPAPAGILVFLAHQAIQVIRGTQGTRVSVDQG